MIRKIALLAFLVTLLLFPLVIQDPYVLLVVNMAGIWVILATSMNIMLGYAGQLPLGQTAFFGLGAYASGLLNVKLGVPFWLGLPIAAIVSTTAGYFIGKLTFKVRGAYFVLVTLGFGEVMRLIVNNWIDLTNGPMGLHGIAPPIFYGIKFSSDVYYYYLILFFDFLSVYVTWRIIHSRYGRAFAALNENEALAGAVGISGQKILLVALMISTFFAGIAGSLYAHYVLFISPDLFFLSYTVTMIIMVVFGGKRTISGPIFGAVAFTILPELLRAAQNYRMAIYGLILMATIFFMKNGVIPSLSNFINHLKKRGERIAAARR